MTTATSMTWNDLPPQPWGEYREPDCTEVVDWLASLSRDQQCWVFAVQGVTWRRESRCYREDHEMVLAGMREQLAACQRQLSEIYADDQAWP